MKICLLVLNNYTNDARVHKEASLLSSSGHDVSVIALWQKDLPEIEYLSGYKIFRIKLISRVWRNRLLSPPIKYLEFAYQVWHLLKHNRYQIYQANDANTLPVAWLVSRLHHAKLTYDAHEFESGRDFGGSYIANIYRKIWSLPEKLFIHKASIVFTVSHTIAGKLSEIYHIPIPVVILNCPEKSTYKISRRLRNELEIPDAYKILLYQGQVSVGRGIEAFLEATQHVDNTVAVVIGDGTALDNFLNKVKINNWKRIHFFGKVPLVSLPSYTASADIGMVLTQDTSLNHHYSLPNKIFEYMHAGIPIIGSDLPEIRRIIQETGTGEVCNPSDVHSIAAAIERIKSNPDLYKYYHDNALAASEVYNWQVEGQKLIDAYATI